MNTDELKEILRKHKSWLNNEEGGERADLRCANLRCVNLRGADLREAYLAGADLREADLRGADLKRANLKRANLKRADLKDADLKDADLAGADLREAYLRGADLKWANLRCADLAGADLRDADLRKAYLREADLRKADFRGADLAGADLRDADLRCAKNVTYIALVCPSDGAFVGWKKVRDKIVKLQIPEDARRSSATTNKCRADKALVLGIYELDGVTESVEKEVVNKNYTSCVYKVGEMVYPDSFDAYRWNECSHGIHFFINKQDAIDY